MDPQPDPYPDDSIDIADLIRRVRRGLWTTVGLTLLGFAVGIILGLVTTSRQTAVSTLRVTFGFPGAENGTYPNGMKFQPDDVRAPDVVSEAVDRLNIADSPPNLISKVRGAVSVSGLVSANVVRERDRLRAAGQTLPTFFPDEYEISLIWPRDDVVDIPQRQKLLTEIVSAYRDKFRRTYVELPEQFSNVFSQLRNADFVEYELILNQQMQTLQAFLKQQIAQAKEFRSPTNNLSFRDLLKQVDLFSQIRMNEVLGLIYLGGLSKDRAHSLANMDYRLRTLKDRERRLIEEEAVVMNLLTKTQQRSQNYVLASQAEATQGSQTVLDQGLIDALLANDAYNFLVRQALEAGRALKQVQSEIAVVQERRERMEAFIKDSPLGQAEATERVQTALRDLESGYQELLANVRTCLEDYARQEYADSIRITKQANTGSWMKPLLLGAIIGCFTGGALGLGLSLLDLGSKRPGQ